MKITNLFKSARCVAAADSECGVRSENQDNYLLVRSGGVGQWLWGQQPKEQKLEPWAAGCFRLAVADGMGGHAYGREMAEAVIESLLDLPALLEPWVLREELFQRHHQLLERFSDGLDPGRPGSTLVLADVNADNGHVVVATVGDSRALLWRNGMWRCLTYDHTEEEFDLRAGELDDTSWLEASRRNNNMLAQAMGYGSFGLIPNQQGFRPPVQSRQLRLDLAEDLPGKIEDHADLFTLRLKRGDALLLASDGLWSNSINLLGRLAPPKSDSEAELERYLEQLIDDAINGQGGSDNVTVALVQRM